MTTNPLALRRGNEPPRFTGPLYGTQEWCDWRNSTMERDDIEWTLGTGGPFLHHRQAFSTGLSKRLDAKAEDDRQKWIHRHNNPQRYVA